jgi:hypothetical protein
MKLFNADAKILLKKFQIFFPKKSWKNPPSKVAQNSSNPLFPLTALTAKTAQTEEFLLQNVAHWLTKCCKMKQRAQTSISSVFVNFSDRNSVNGGDDSGILKEFWYNAKAIWFRNKQCESVIFSLFLFCTTLSFSPKSTKFHYINHDVHFLTLENLHLHLQHQRKLAFSDAKTR